MLGYSYGYPWWDRLKGYKLNGKYKAISYDSSEWFKYVKFGDLFDGIYLGLEYWITLGSPVRASVGAYEGFKDDKLDVATNENSLGG